MRGHVGADLQVGPYYRWVVVGATGEPPTARGLSPLLNNPAYKLDGWGSGREPRRARALDTGEAAEGEDFPCVKAAFYVYSWARESLNEAGRITLTR